MHTAITCEICNTTCVASSSGVHSTFPTHMVFPKRSVILLWVSVLLLIAVLLLSWVVFLYFSPFMLQTHVTSDIPRATRHLLVCTQHSTWGAPSGRGRGVRSTLLQRTQGKSCCCSMMTTMEPGTPATPGTPGHPHVDPLHP